MAASPIHIEKKNVDSPLSSLNHLEAPLSTLKEKKNVLRIKSIFPGGDFIHFFQLRSLCRLSLLEACPIPGTSVRGPKQLAESERKRKNPPRNTATTYAGIDHIKSSATSDSTSEQENEAETD